MKSAISLINHDSQSLTAKIDAVFILCERCYWCATYSVADDKPHITIVYNAAQTTIN